MKKISKNQHRANTGRPYRPQAKTVKRFTANFRAECKKEGLITDAFEQVEMWDLIEIKLGRHLLKFIEKSPIV